MDHEVFYRVIEENNFDLTPVIQIDNTCAHINEIPVCKPRLWGYLGINSWWKQHHQAISTKPFPWARIMHLLAALMSYPAALAVPLTGSTALSCRHWTLNLPVIPDSPLSLSTSPRSSLWCAFPAPSLLSISNGPEFKSQRPVRMGKEGWAISFPRTGVSF